MSNEFDNFNSTIHLTPRQIADASETFLKIANNLAEIKQDTQKCSSLTEGEKALLISKIDREDHLTFKSICYASGSGDVDLLCDHKDCGCFSDNSDSSIDDGGEQ